MRLILFILTVARGQIQKVVFGQGLRPEQADARWNDDTVPTVKVRLGVKIVKQKRFLIILIKISKVIFNISYHYNNHSISVQFYTYCQTRSRTNEIIRRM